MMRQSKSLENRENSKTQQRAPRHLKQEETKSRKSGRGSAAEQNELRDFKEKQTEDKVNHSSNKKSKEKDGKKDLLRFLIKLLVLTAAAWALLTFVMGVFVCHGNDMYPAVRDGDLLITWRLKAYERDGIVSYRHEGNRYLGRVVGLPGDTVHIDADGNYTINGGVPYETVYYETRAPEDSPVDYPYIVQEGELFVLSDLRENMRDSREFGAVSQKDTDGSLALLLRRRSW